LRVSKKKRIVFNPGSDAVVISKVDPKTDQLIIFGGSTGDSNLMSSMNGETWIYTIPANTWVEVISPSSPSPRDNVGLAYDIESDRIILFGGASSKDFNMMDTWSFDMGTRIWTEMKPGPPYHMGSSMVYNNKADRMIVWGGFIFEKNTATNDIWAYDYNSDTWTEMKPAVSPPARNFQSMVYDSKADRIIMWGGWGTTNADNETSVWIYDYNANTWQERKTDLGPSSRAFHYMSYDPKADRTILYGGYTGGIPDAAWQFSTNSSETRAYDYNLNTWTLLAPAINPGPLSSAGQVYVPSIDRLFLFGGKLDVTKYSDKIWLYSFDANTWTEVVPNP
jgi:hypothetical protein